MFSRNCVSLERERHPNAFSVNAKSPAAVAQVAAVTVSPSKDHGAERLIINNTAVTFNRNRETDIAVRASCVLGSLITIRSVISLLFSLCGST